MRRPANLGIIGHREGLAPWLERLRSGKLGVDTETTGLQWTRDRVGGLCFAAGRTAVYAYGDALGPAARWLGDQVKRERPLVFHHGKFDLHMCRGTFGLHVPYVVDDTMLMSFLLDNRGALVDGKYSGNGLKPLATAFVDPRAEEVEEKLRAAVVAAGGSRKKNEWKRDILLAPPEIVGEYGALDAWYTLRLDQQFQERIDHWVQPVDGDYPSLRSLYETERWLMRALVDMEGHGILVREKFFASWRDQLVRRRKKIIAKLEEMTSRDINWSNPHELRPLLFEDLGIAPAVWTEGGKSGIKKPSTNEVALAKMDHPIGAVLLKLRAVDKQLTSYADNLLAAIWEDGRVHCNFKQDGARTGRLSCTKPNLQQQARDSGVRKGFVPDPELVFRFADYSQVEMRFAAHLSNDPTLVKGFRHDPDFDTHAATAMKMWGLTRAPTKQQRKSAKIMNFAMLFGAGEAKVTSQLISLLSRREARRAARSLGHSFSPGEPEHRTLASLLRQVYFKEFSAVKNAKYRAEKSFKQLGYTINEFGRHRFMSENEGYKAFNTVIQGSAADLAKRGIVALYRGLQLGEGSIILQLQIHDEAVYLSDGDPETDRRAIELLNDETSFRVPMIAEMSGSSRSWHHKEDIEL